MSFSKSRTNTAKKQHNSNKVQRVLCILTFTNYEAVSIKQSDIRDFPGFDTNCVYQRAISKFILSSQR